MEEARFISSLALIARELAMFVALNSLVVKTWNSSFESIAIDLMDYVVF